MSVQSQSYLHALRKVEPKEGSTITSRAHAVGVERLRGARRTKWRRDDPVAVMHTLDMGVGVRMVYGADLARQLAAEVARSLDAATRRILAAEILDMDREEAGEA